MKGRVDKLYLGNDPAGTQNPTWRNIESLLIEHGDKRKKLWVFKQLSS